MARIVFISLYDEFAPGVRILVATLKQAGHFAAMISFKSYGQYPLKDIKELYEGMHIQALPSGDYVNAYSFPPTPTEDRLLIDLIRKLQPDLVGVSLTYVQKVAATRITAMIKNELGLPVMWGGPQPTTSPEDCIKIADYVCRGEAEDVILEVAAKIDAGNPFTDVLNIWSRLPDGSIVKNIERPLRQDLSVLPFPDYSKESVFFIDKDELRCGLPFPDSDLNTNYIITTVRGCPYACTYCYQSYLKTIYKNQRFVRERPLDRVLKELKLTKERMGHFYLEILDNVFTLKESRMAEFTKRYHEEINEPFWCYTHPRCCKENVIRHLAQCPNFEYIIMGIESVSQNIGVDVFNRKQTPEVILNAARILNKYNIRAFYDLITNVPGETEGDCMDNLNMLRAIPKPFRIRLSKLSIFPNYLVNQETKGRSRLVSEKRYRVWNALYFLTQDLDFSDHEINAILDNPFFEEHPEILEKLNVVFDERWNDLTYLKSRNNMFEIELEDVKNRRRALNDELARLKGRKGFREFLWLHRQAELTKKKIKSIF
ncbi:radical SAM protein [Candidatus Sumerlaeota bacterium]|nr:radical SAM protein [Candidatus Sumerlaeota bacterium]